MKVSFTPEAEEQVEASDTWWRENRKDAHDLFARELAATKALLAISPKLGTIYTILDGRPMRRVLMAKTRHHVYYAADLDAGVIVIHAVWGAPRGIEPTF